MKTKRAPGLAGPRSGVATTRRSFVVGALGGVTAAAVLEACGGDSNPGNAGGGTGGTGTAGLGGGGGTDPAAGAGGTPTAGAGGTPTAGAGGGAGAGAGDGSAGTDGGVCTLYPQQTAGPFYLDLDLLRSDVTEGRPGAAMTLVVQVLNAASCAPVKAAAVDIWQCDAAGVYSGFAGQLGGLDTTGQKFLRGTQLTNEEGRVEFQSIYPGWYPGRTTHIHFAIHLSSTSEVSSQMYFPEDVTTEVYQTPPYSSRGQKDTSNITDSVARSNLPPLVRVSKTATGYQATLTVTVAG